MNHVKLLEEEKIKMVSITDDDLRRQQAFTLDVYNFHQCQHKPLINFLIEANHARLVAETTADRKNIAIENLTSTRQVNRSEKGCTSIT